MRRPRPAVTITGFRPGSIDTRDLRRWLDRQRHPIAGATSLFASLLVSILWPGPTVRHPDGRITP